MEYPKKLPLLQPNSESTGAYFFAKDPYVFFVLHKDYAIDMHSHDYCELCIVTKGVGRHYIEENAMDIQAGNVFVIPPGVKHGFHNGKGLDVFHAVIENRFFEKYGFALQGMLGYSLLFDAEPLVRQNSDISLFLFLSPKHLSALMGDLQELLSFKTADYPSVLQLKNIAFTHLLAKLCRAMYAQSTRLNKHGWSGDNGILQSVEYIHAHYPEKLFVEDLAKVACMAKSTYSRRFSVLLGESPLSYVNRVRVEKSKELLKQTDMDITAIAIACGFFDASHYIKFFKKYYALSPRVFRNKQ